MKHNSGQCSENGRGGLLEALIRCTLSTAESLALTTMHDPSVSRPRPLLGRSLYPLLVSSAILIIVWGEAMFTLFDPPSPPLFVQVTLEMTLQISDLAERTQP